MPTKPDASQIVLRREKRRQKKRKGLAPSIRRVASGLLAVISIILVLVIIYGAYTYSRVAANLPSIENLSMLLDAQGLLRHPTQLYDRTGENLLLSLENPNAYGSEYIYLEAIPQYMINATLAYSDPLFWEHDGYTNQAEKLTLAQRLVSDLLLWQEEDSWEKSWRVNLLAAQATHEYGQEKILEWYLNNANYGHLAYGVDEAARVYFGKPLRDITLAEAAMLAAIADAPDLNPIDAASLAIERQGQVLQLMLVQGYLTTDEAFNANVEPIHIQPEAPPAIDIAPTFTTLVIRQLDEEIGKERLMRGGFKIITTLDLDLQTNTECTVIVQIARVSGEIPLNQTGGINCPAANLLPILKSDTLIPEGEVEAGVVVIDPLSGEVLTLVGDPTQAHQPGTILSPFIYLTGFTRGLNPASLVWDIPASVPPFLKGVENQDSEYHGPMHIRTALANDYLVPALATLSKVGPSNVWQTALQSGLHSLEIPGGEDNYRLILNQGAVNLLEITHAYSMFSNQGVLAGQSIGGAENGLHAATVLTVKDYSGRTWVDWTTPKEQSVASPQLAFLMTNVLADEITRRETLGYPNPLETGRPSAAMIGENYSGNSAWTVGYTPERVVGVWLGVSGSTDGEEGETEKVPHLAAAGLWNAVLKTAHEDLPIVSWKEPVGISYVSVCTPSGLLPTEECPATVREVFIAGEEPTQTDNLYRSFLINRETGRLATVYTPPEFVEERVFMVVPAEAIDWAREAGLEIPPVTYDVIFNPPTDEFVTIISPEIFSYVSGEVTLYGRASGEDFAFYRVQIGEGLNPRMWLQVGEDISEPVTEGILMVWDTTGLDGLHAIQLLVVNTDSSVTSYTIQVTVDNTPPFVQITHPAEGQSFTSRAVTFQAQANDNLGIAKVEFFVDGESISSLAEPPYAAPWTGTSGAHTLVVIVTDLAGNVSEDSVVFTLGE